MKPQFCPNFDFIVWRYNRLNQVELTRLRCKSWSCDYCAKLNREMWRSHLKKRIGKMGGTWWFITITAHEGSRVSVLTLANLRRGLDLLFKRMRRVWEKIEYVRVFEVHKTGAFHAHLVISGLSDKVLYYHTRAGKRAFRPSEHRGKEVWSLKTWFKKSCRAVKMGYMVDVQRMDSITKTVNYICKYITKSSQAFYEKGLRRIQTSQGIGAVNPRKPASGWQIGKYVWAGEVGKRDLKDLNLKMTIRPSFWRDNYTYPNTYHE